MTSSSSNFVENPFFVRYGGIVSQLFQPDAGPVTPDSLFPTVVEGRVAGTRRGLPEYADTREFEFIRNTIDRLRAELAAESTNTTRKFKEFLDALGSGTEAMLDDNPFYELTGLVYRLDIAALGRGFADRQADLLEGFPRSITVSRSLRQIWTSKSEVTDLKTKLWETVGKLGFFGKLTVGLLLFAGSTLTTAKGVMDLVQFSGFTDHFGQGLSGAGNESLRLGVALAIGLLLSSVILDFKSRLFRGIADTGLVFKGFAAAFKRHPRWIVACVFLTAISIWTNYDGIVLLMSKSSDLEAQYRTIREEVTQALGSSRHPNPANPGSLADLDALLTGKVADTIQALEAVPADEVSGKASSGDARKGPRYWGKQFVVFGGHEAGVRDVTRSHGPGPLPAGIDAMLVGSGLDLKGPVADKLNRLLHSYRSEFTRTENLVLHKLDTLGNQMTLREGFDLAEFQTVFSLESYHVNDAVAEIVVLLERNKKKFVQVVEELNRLTGDHIALLEKVDKAGGAAANRYRIDVAVAVPSLEAIDRLKQGRISEAQRRSLSELRAFLLETHGVVLGTILLLTILFIAIAMDLSDPILYSAMVARWGRRDRQFLEENIRRFHQWEARYIHGVRAFLVRPDVRPILPHLTAPREVVIHDAYHRFLEGLNPAVKDASSFGLVERLRFWFFGLFTTTRTGFVVEYNARQQTTLAFLSSPANHSAALLNMIFPGVMNRFRIGVDFFDPLFKRIDRDMRRWRDEVASTLDDCKDRLLAVQNPESIFHADFKASGPDGRTGPAAGPTAPRFAVEAGNRLSSVEGGGRPPPSIKVTVEAGNRLSSVEGGGRLPPSIKIRSVALRWLKRVFLNNLAPPEPGFPLTRVGWYRNQARIALQTRARVNRLVRFTPLLLRLLGERIPAIRAGVIQPLMETITHIPNWGFLERALDLEVHKRELSNLQKDLEVLLGLSRFQEIELDDKTLRSIMEDSTFPEIREVFLGSTNDEGLLDKRIDALEKQLRLKRRLVDGLVGDQDTLIEIVTRTRRDHLTPMEGILAHLENRTRMENALGLTRIRRELDRAEGMLLALWDSSLETLEEQVGESSLLETLPDILSDLVTLLSCAEDANEFPLLMQLQELQETTGALNVRLNQRIFVLTFVDKILTKVDGQLNESLGLLREIRAQENRLAATAGVGGPEDGRRLAFLKDNRLFIKSIPMQVEAIRRRLEHQLQDPDFSEPHRVELFRLLESQAFRLHYFLRAALAFLQGEPGALAPAAVSMAPAAPRGPVPAAKPEEWDPSGGFALPPTPAWTPAQQVRDQCREVLRLLPELAVREWDLLKHPMPPPDHLRALEEHRPLLDGAYGTVETLLETLKKFAEERAGQDPDADSIPLLQALLVRSGTLLRDLEGLARRISVTPFVDRRSERSPQPAAKPSSGQVQRREADQKAEDCPKKGLSRRTAERIRIRSGVQLTLPGVGTLVGESLDVSNTGLCLHTDHPLHGMKTGLSGSLQLVTDSGENRFPCMLQRLAGTLIIVTIAPAHQAAFVNLMRQTVLREREREAGFLDRNHPPLPA
ncbi:MAG: hypothetical protein HQL82_14340 [Magnetococcales bacterium]|nr:hypothetical protein [Magnetococcales bacterium]